MDIMNSLIHLNGPEYGHFLHIGLLGSPFHFSLIILNDNLRTTVCLSDVKIDIYKLNEIHDFLIGPFPMPSHNN